MPRIPSPSLLQMMKAVAFVAVAFACVAPLLRTWRAGAVHGGAWSGLVAIAIVGGVAIPVAWTGLAVLLIRPGSRRDGLIAAFLLGSLVAGVAVGRFARSAKEVGSNDASSSTSTPSGSAGTDASFGSLPRPGELGVTGASPTAPPTAADPLVGSVGTGLGSGAPSDAAVTFDPASPR